MAAPALDLLAVAPLPYRLAGRGHFQLGGGLYCASLLLGLAGLGHRIRVLASGPWSAAHERPEPLGGGVEVEWFALDYRTAGEPPPADYVRAQQARFETELDRAVAERRPDLVLLGSESQAWYVAEPCRDRGLPTLLVAHGVPTAALPAGIYPPAAVRALVAKLGFVDRIVTVARHLETVLRELGVTRVQTIPTGIDTDAFRPRAKDPGLLATLGIEPDRPVVGSFSHMRPEKRVADLVAAAELVLGSEPRALFLVAGDGPCRGAIGDLVAEKRIGESFRFLGELDHAQVPAHMALSDLVVLASEREGCSLLCREAHASGRALVVSDIPAAREIVNGGETGLLFRLGDVDDLAAKIVELARDPTRRDALAEKGRAAALATTKERWIHACSDALVRTARRGR